MKEMTSRERNRKVEPSTTQLIDTITHLQAEVENLKLELSEAKKTPSGKISLVFLIPGSLSLGLSLMSNSQVLAFVGLGLTFWGALFFFVKPTAYVDKAVLDSTASSIYKTIDRIVKDLQYAEKGYYIPPYPKEVYLPEHLKGLKDMILFIARTDSETAMPSIEEMAQSKFHLKNPKGIILAPPGLGLLSQFEKELGIEIRRMELSELCESLPQMAVENLQLAKEMTMVPEEDLVYLKASDSLYKNLYNQKETSSVRYVGCPLASAIACAIATSTGRTVAIHENKISSDGLTLEVWYHFVEG